MHAPDEHALGMSREPNSGPTWLSSIGRLPDFDTAAAAPTSAGSTSYYRQDQYWYATGGRFEPPAVTGSGDELDQLLPAVTMASGRVAFGSNPLAATDSLGASAGSARAAQQQQYLGSSPATNAASSSSSSSSTSTSSGSTSSTRLTKSTRSYNVVGAIHPVTKVKLSLAEALECGVLNREQGVYYNLATGEQTKLADAVQRGLVLTEPTDGSGATSGSGGTTAAAGAAELVTLREATYRVVGVLHPKTRERLTVARAVELGILDASGGYYRGGSPAQMTVAEAIDQGLVLVEQGSSAVGGAASSLSARRDPKKVASIHIEEEEQETLTVVEETLTETKKWIITSVIDPRSRQRVSYDEAVQSGVLDQTAGVYRNPDTGEKTPIAKAIETGLIEGELISVNTNGDEFLSYSTADPGSKASASTGSFGVQQKQNQQQLHHLQQPQQQQPQQQQLLLNGVGVHSVTSSSSSSSSTSRTLEPSSYGATDSYSGRFTVQDAQAASAGSDQEDVRSRARSVLDRARLYTEQSSISQTERKLTGYTTDWARERVYELGTGYEMSFDEAIARGVIDANKVAVMRKFKEQQEKAKAMAASVAAPPPAGLQRTQAAPASEPMGPVAATVVSTTAPLVLSSSAVAVPPPSPSMLAPSSFSATSPSAHNKLSVLGAAQHSPIRSGSVAEYRKIAVSKSIAPEDDPSALLALPSSGGSDRVTMTLHLPTQTSPSSGGGIEPRIGPLPYEVAVKLGLFNVKTGRYRDPVSEALLSFQDATAWGHLHPNGAAFTNLNTGQPLTLDEAVRQSLVDPDSGRPVEGRLRQLNVAVPDAFAVSRFISPPPLNVEDAVKVGLLSAATAVLTHPQSADETRSLGEAVRMRLIDGKSAVVWHPGSGGGIGGHARKYYIDDALRQRILDPDTGDLTDPKTGAKIMSFYDALKNHHIESVYDPVHLTVIDPNTGIRVDVAQAVKRGLLGPDTCLVYDTEMGRQVPFEDALARDIVDRQAGIYKDKKGARNLLLATAFEMGLIEPVGAPLLHRMKMSDALARLYPAISAPAMPAASTVLSPMSSHSSMRLQMVPSAQQPLVANSVEYLQESVSRTLHYTEDSSTSSSSSSISSAPSPGSKQGRTTAERPRDRSPPERRTLTPVEEEPVGVTRQPVRTEAPELSRLFDDLPSRGRPADSPLKAPGVSAMPAAQRPSTDGISDPEYFVKGGEHASNRLLRDDDHPIDYFVPTVKTPCPKSVQWDISLVKPTPATASVQRNVSEEETIRNVKKTNKMLVSVEAKAKPFGSDSPQADLPRATASPSSQSSTAPADDAIDGQPRQKQPQQQQPQPPSTGPAYEDQPRIKDKEIIIIDRQGPTVRSNVFVEQLTIDSAVEQGLVTRLPSGSWLYTDPQTGERMSLADAVRRGLVRGSVDEARRALEISSRLGSGAPATGGESIVEYVTTQEYSSVVEKNPSDAAGMPFADAVDSGQFDARTGTFRSPVSGLTCSLREAVDRGLIDGSSAEFVHPGSKRVLSLRDALDQRALDADGRWVNPATGTKKTLDEAIKKGFVALTVSKQTVNRITTVKETKRAAVEHVVHPVTRQCIGLAEALREDIVQPSNAVYRNPATGDSLPLDEALRCGLVKGRVIDSKRTTEERIVDSTSIVSRRNESLGQPNGENVTSVLKVLQSPTKTFAILSVTDPGTNLPLTATEAIDKKIIDLGQALYKNTVTGEVITFEEAIKRKLIRCVETTDLPTEDRFNITGVVDPRTGLQISLADAIADGIVDFEKGLYVNIITGNSVPIETAVRRRLIVADGKVPENLTQQAAASSDEEVVDSVFVQTRTYSITHAVDPRSQEKIGISEALRRGLLDESLAVFHDLQSGTDMTVQEAIDKGFLIASESEPSKTKAEAGESRTIQKSSVFSVEKVVDPKTKEEITPKEAVSRGIIDEATGDYVNVDTMENWSMERAIREGVVKARPPVSPALSVPANETVSFSIDAVVDPKTGEQMSVSDALRHGFLDRNRQTFVNPQTGETLPLQEAVQRGWIKLKTNYEKSRSLPRGTASRPGSASSRSAQQQQPPAVMAIRSVTDPRTGEELSVAQAVRQGVLDRSGRSYHNSVTGETIGLDVAAQRGLIRLASSAATTTTAGGRDAERLVGTADGGLAELTVREATRRGLVNARSGKYIHPGSGQVMPVDEAVRRGYLQRDEQHDDPTTGTAAAAGAASSSQQLPGASGTWRVPYTLQRRSPSPSRAAATTRRRPTGGTSAAANGEVPAADVAAQQQSQQQQAMSMDVLSAARQGLIDSRSGTFTHPASGQRLTVDDALIQGLLTTQAAVVPTLFRPRGPNPLSVAEAIQRGLVNLLSLDVLNTHTGQWMTFDEALSSGYVQPRLSAGAGASAPGSAPATASLPRAAGAAGAAETAATTAAAASTMMSTTTMPRAARAGSMPRQLASAGGDGSQPQSVTSHHSWQTHEVVSWQQQAPGQPALLQQPPPPQFPGLVQPPPCLQLAAAPPLQPPPPLALPAGGSGIGGAAAVGTSRQETLSRTSHQLQQQPSQSLPVGQSGTYQRTVSQQQQHAASFKPSSPVVHGRQRLTAVESQQQQQQQIQQQQQQLGGTHSRRANSVPPRSLPVESQQQQYRSGDTLRRPSGTVLPPLANSTAHFVNGRLYAVRPGYFIDASGAVIHSSSGAHTTISQALSGDIIQLLPDEDEEEALRSATFGRHGTLGSTFVDKASIPWDRGFTLERFMGEPVVPPPLLPPPLLPPPPLVPPPLATMQTPLPPFGSLGRQTLPDLGTPFGFNDSRQLFTERTPANTFV